MYLINSRPLQFMTERCNDENRQENTENINMALSFKVKWEYKCRSKYSQVGNGRSILKTVKRKG